MTHRNAFSRGLGAVPCWSQKRPRQERGQDDERERAQGDPIPQLCPRSGNDPQGGSRENREACCLPERVEQHRDEPRADWPLKCFDEREHKQAFENGLSPVDDGRTDLFDSRLHQRRAGYWPSVFFSRAASLIIRRISLSSAGLRSELSRSA